MIEHVVKVSLNMWMFADFLTFCHAERFEETGGQKVTMSSDIVYQGLLMSGLLIHAKLSLFYHQKCIFCQSSAIQPR